MDLLHACRVKSKIIDILSITVGHTTHRELLRLIGLIKPKGRSSPPWVQSLRVVLHEVTLFEHDLVDRWGWCGKTWYAVSYRSLQICNSL